MRTLRISSLRTRVFQLKLIVALLVWSFLFYVQIGHNEFNATNIAASIGLALTVIILIFGKPFALKRIQLENRQLVIDKSGEQLRVPLESVISIKHTLPHPKLPIEIKFIDHQEEKNHVTYKPKTTIIRKIR